MIDTLFSCHKCKLENKIPLLSTDTNFSPSPISFGVSSSQQFSSSSNERSIECIEANNTSLSSLLGMSVSSFPQNCSLAWLNSDSIKTGSAFGSGEFGCVACKSGYKAIRKPGNESFLIGNYFENLNLRIL